MEHHRGDLVPLRREDGFGNRDPFFSSTWEEFDQERHQMMKKSNGFWDKVDQDMKEFEASVSKMEADMDRMTAPLRPSLPDWALPEDHRKNWPMISGQGEMMIVCEICLFQFSFVRFWSAGDCKDNRDWSDVGNST